MPRLRLFIATLLLIVGLVVVPQLRFIRVEQYYAHPPQYVVAVRWQGYEVMHIQPKGARFALYLRGRRLPVLVLGNAWLDVTMATPTEGIAEPVG